MMSDEVIIMIIFLAFSIPAAVCDAIRYRFPVILPVLGFFTILGFLIYSQKELIWPLAGAAAVCLILFLARLFTSGSLGKGDIIFGAFMGISLGMPWAVLALLLSAVLGIFYYVFIRISKSKKAHETAVYHPVFAIPYVPFLTAGTLIVQLSLFIF